MSRKSLFKKADAVIIAALLALAGLLLLLRGGGKAAVAEITVDGETLYEIALSDVKESYTITLPNGVEIGVDPGGIRFLASDCRGQDCVRCGVLTKAGQAAACVPNKTVIVLRGAPESGGTDAISY